MNIAYLVDVPQPHHVTKTGSLHSSAQNMNFRAAGSVS